MVQTATGIGDVEMKTFIQEEIKVREADNRPIYQP